MENVQLSIEEGYRTMILFLEGLHQRNNSDDLAEFLSSMDINKHDGRPMDPALWYDWIDAIKGIRHIDYLENAQLSIDESYRAMILFLEGLCQRTNSDDLPAILGSMDINKHDGRPMDPALWDDWMDAIKGIK